MSDGVTECWRGTYFSTWNRDAVPEKTETTPEKDLLQAETDKKQKAERHKRFLNITKDALDGLQEFFHDPGVADVIEALYQCRQKNGGLK